VNSIKFLITDTEHKLYYISQAAAKIFDTPVEKLVGNLWFSYVASSPPLVKKLAIHDLNKQGFFNGFIRLDSSPTLYFCDYGKRYDAQGNHIGYDMVLTQTNQEASDYVTHLYQGLEERLKQSPDLTAEQIYEQEKASVEQNVGSEFSEFLLAIQDKHED
tara:strand:- start:57 stop:536 length:480 start_codon:yes stop_codon:yes gene_type:complete